MTTSLKVLVGCICHRNPETKQFPLSCLFPPQKVEQTLHIRKLQEPNHHTLRRWYKESIPVPLYLLKCAINVSFNITCQYDFKYILCTVMIQAPVSFSIVYFKQANCKSQQFLLVIKILIGFLLYLCCVRKKIDIIQTHKTILSFQIF